MADYLSGDPYRQFAAAALGVLSPTEQQRQAYKAVVLGRIYGKGVVSLARDLGIDAINPLETDLRALLGIGRLVEARTQ